MIKKVYSVALFAVLATMAVSEMLEPLRNIVHADLEGGFWGGSVGLFGSAAAAVVSSGGVAIGVFAGCWCVGATVSSIVYAENH